MHEGQLEMLWLLNLVPHWMALGQTVGLNEQWLEGVKSLFVTSDKNSKRISNIILPRV